MSHPPLSRHADLQQQQPQRQHRTTPLAAPDLARHTLRRARIGVSAAAAPADAAQASAGARRQRSSSALIGLALLVGGALAQRPAHAAEPWLLSNGLGVGAAAGSSDYGNAFKGSIGSGGSGLSLAGVPGLWRWEVQAQSYGSETYRQFSNSYKRSAWSLGASVMPQLPVMPALAAYAKLGLHYLSSHASGPGLDSASTGIKPGLGAGLRWQALARASVKFEYENIGNAGGDVLSLGLEFAL
jgi:hypothetical protein